MSDDKVWIPTKLSTIPKFTIRISRLVPNEKHQKMDWVEQLVPIEDAALIAIEVDGYEDAYGTPEIALFEVERERDLVMRVWADKDLEDPTYTVSFEGARTGE